MVELVMGEREGLWWAKFWTEYEDSNGSFGLREKKESRVDLVQN